jgi:hypothetical protein
MAVNTIFSEPNTDYTYDVLDLSNQKYFAIKNLAAQFDIRSESAIQCLKILNPNCSPKV